MKMTLFAATVLTAATAATAQSAPAGVAGRAVHTREAAVERVRTMFARVDANRDGAISEDETAALRGQAQAVRRARVADPARQARTFERLDRNNDNMISREEWAEAQAQRAQRQTARGGERGQRVAMRGRMGGVMLRMADADRDRRVTLQEAEAAALRRFDRVDLNRDGRITPAERQQLRGQWQQRGDMRR